MTSRTISTHEANRQFDMLFDEYMELTMPWCQPNDMMQLCGIQADAGREIDEVCTDSPEDADKAVMKKLALLLRDLGDCKSEKLKPVSQEFLPQITKAFVTNKALPYSEFEGIMKEVPLDRTAEDFVMLMTLTKDVALNVGGGGANRVKGFFRGFISEIFRGPLSRAGGVRNFLTPQQQ